MICLLIFSDILTKFLKACLCQKCGIGGIYGVIYNYKPHIF
ncbi:hypothetical protein CLOSPO_03638 [Clostridium sporogenes ATCC 15579]|nr:hypothetical protein CLOSPO_03638 [Clostridium sporogenes ATCC 15579]